MLVLPLLMLSSAAVARPTPKPSSQLYAGGACQTASGLVPGCLHTSGQESRAVVYAAGSPVEEVLRFEEDGSIYLRGRFVGKDPAIARIVKQESEGRR